MKKLFFCLLAIIGATACASVQEAKNFANCKYTISAIEVADYNVNSLSLDVALSITNLNKKHDAAIKKFDGKFLINDLPASDILLEDIRIEAGTTKPQQVHLTIPMRSLNTKLIGLVGMGSVSVDYKITGTAYFDTPLGEVPMPVNIGRRGSNN